jgi:hypothetical protein
VQSDPHFSPRSATSREATGHSAPLVADRASSADSNQDWSLDDACAALVRAEWAADAAPSTAHDPVWDRFRSAITLYVATCKAERMPPERILVELKTALHSCLRKQGRERDELVLRRAILSAFIVAYYDSDQSR